MQAKACDAGKACDVTLKMKTRDIVVMLQPDEAVGEQARVLWEPTMRKDGVVNPLKVFK